MLIRIVEILFPLFAITALGYVVGRRMKPDLSQANKLNMDVFVPALVFAALANKAFDISAFLPLVVAVSLIVVGSGLVAWALARALGMQPKTLVPPIMFNNCGNLGLPLAVLTFGDTALAPMVVMFMVSNLVHFSFGAWLLDHRVRLADSRISAVGIGVFGALARPLIGLALAWGVLQLIELPAREQALLLVFGALPPAVLNFMFAERYQQEPGKVASMVLIGNLAAVVFLPLALALVLD